MQGEPDEGAAATVGPVITVDAPMAPTKAAALTGRKPAEESKEQLPSRDDPTTTDDEASSASSTTSDPTASSGKELSPNTAPTSDAPLTFSPPPNPSPIHLPKSSTSSSSRRPQPLSSTSVASKTPATPPKGSSSSPSPTSSSPVTPRPPSKPSTPTASSRPHLTVTPSAPSTSRRPSAIATPLPSPPHARTTEETLGFFGHPPPPSSPPIHSLCSDNRYDAVLDLLHTTPLHLRTRLVNLLDPHHNTPLYYTLLTLQHAPLLTLLLDYGADPNHVNAQRNSPLHIACHLGQRRAIHSLIEGGAHIKVENWEHQQPHQMVKAPGGAAVMQGVLNAAWEGWQERVKGGGVPGAGMDREVRGYYRGVFDTLDRERVGGLTWGMVEKEVRAVLREREERKEKDNLKPVVRLSAAEREKEKATAAAGAGGGGGGGVGAVDWVLSWFRAMDADHNGVISFPEFLTAVVAWKADVEKEAQKGKKKKK